MPSATKREPYPGPVPLTEDDEIYGRDNELLELLNLVRADRLVLLYSVSGAGKTSILRAGLKPRLPWRNLTHLGPIHVGLDPPRGFTGNRYVNSVEQSLGGAGTDSSAGDSSLEQILSRHAGSAEGHDGCVLLFDQFEEVLTRDPTDEAAKTEFFEELGKLLRAEPEHERVWWAVFAMREDSLPAMGSYLRLLPGRLQSRMRLELLRKPAALEAIHGPEKNHQFQFVREAAEELLRDLCMKLIPRSDGQVEAKETPFIEPVLLQAVCRLLWQRRMQPDTITLADLRSLAGDDGAGGQGGRTFGSVERALELFYREEVSKVAQATNTSEAAIRDWVQTRLITSPALPSLRQRSFVVREAGSSAGMSNTVIDELIKAHILRQETGERVWVEVAHDRLIEPITRDNAEWRRNLEERRQSNLSVLQRQAADWESTGRQDGLLLREKALEDAEDWANQHQGELTPTETAFLTACRNLRERVRRDRRKNTIILVVAVLASCLLLANVIQGIRARSLTLQNMQQQLLSAAITKLEIDPDRSLELAVEAASTDTEVTLDVVDLLDRALSASRVRHVFRGHDGYVMDVAFSPDGKRLATASADTTAKVWNADDPSNKPLSFFGHTGPVYSVAFSPDGKRLATASRDGTARVWDANDPSKTPLSFSGHTTRVDYVAFSPDGKRLATASRDGTAKVWNANDSNKTPLTFTGHQGAVNGLAFSPDGRELVTVGADATAMVWDANNPSSKPRPFLGHAGVIFCVAYSPDIKRWVATGSEDGRVKIWDARSREEIRTLSGHTETVASVDFDSDGKRLATASADGTAKVWDSNSGTVLFTLLRHEAPVTRVTFRPDGTRVATGSWDRTARIWDAVSGHTDVLTSVAFSPDGKHLATASWDKTAKVWDNRSHKVLLTLTGHTLAILNVAFSADGRRLGTAGADGVAKLWDVTSGKELHSFSGHEGKVRSISFSRDGRWLATGGEDGKVIVRDAGSAKEVHSIRAHRAVVYGIAFSNDGRRLATAGVDSTAKLKLWDVKSEQLVREIPPEPRTGAHEGYIFAIALSADGRRLASVGADGNAKLWDTESSGVPRSISAHQGLALSVAFSPNGKLLATSGSDRVVKVWDVDSGEMRRKFAVHTGSVNQVAFDPDGKHLASVGADGNLFKIIIDKDELIAAARARLAGGSHPDR